MSKDYFKLNEEVFFISGKNNALYNTFSGDIYVLTEEEGVEIKRLEKGGKISQNRNENVAIELIEKLERLHLGSRKEKNIYVEKITMYPNWFDFLCFKPAPVINRVTIELGGCDKNCVYCDNERYRRYTECFVNDKYGLKESTISLDKYVDIIKQLNLLGCKELLILGNDMINNSQKKERLIMKALESGIPSVMYIHCIECLNTDIAKKMSDKGAHLILQSDRTNIDYKIIEELIELKVMFSILLIVDYEESISTNSMVKELSEYGIEVKIDFVFRKNFNKEKIMECYHSQIPKINITEFSYNRRYNRCLNGTFVIQYDGTIVPCLGLRDCRVGNVQKIGEIFETGKIQKYWELNKDYDENCKDCGLRYACFDCKSLEKKLGGGLNLTVSCRRKINENS